MASLFVIKMINFHDCLGCNDILKSLRKIEGVEELQIDKERNVTISISKNLNKVTKKLKQRNKTYQLIDTSILQKPAPEVVEEKIAKVGNCPKCNHVMNLKNYEKLYHCDGCDEKGFGERYRCDDCGYELHEVCMSPSQTISPEIFEGYTFKFEPRRPPNPQQKSIHSVIYDACAKDIRGHFYRCDAEDLNLHPLCSQLKAKFPDIGSSNLVLQNKFSSSSSSLSQCKHCNQKWLLGNKKRSQGCSYVSTDSNVRFHVYCITKLTDENWNTEHMNGANDYFYKELDNFNSKKHGENSKKKGGGSDGGGFWNTLSVIISTIAACLMGNPIPVLVPFLLGLFLKAVPKFLKY